MVEGRVSVIVPIYNVEQYLDRCLTSIVNQSYQELEIILVDDGSPDKCPLLCEEWAKRDSRIKVIHKKNAGLGYARNTGIEHATGEYICFFDSDDYVDKSTIEKALSLARKEKAELVVFGSNRVNKDGNVTTQTVPASEKSSYHGEDVQKIFLPDLLECGIQETSIHNLCLSAWSCLFSMELIESTQWRFESERRIISEDSYSLLRLYKDVNCVAILSEPLYYYCENGESLTQTYRADRYEKLKHYYRQMLILAAQMGYNEEVFRRIASLFFSYSIGAMKQIVEADMKRCERRKRLAQIVENDVMQEALQRASYTYRSRAKQLLCVAVRHKMTNFVFLMIELWNAKHRLSGT